MFITMVGDGTAFASLVFGYFFYWTIHVDFTAGLSGPGVFWPLSALGLFGAAWLAMIAARALNNKGAATAMRASLVVSLTLTAGGCLAAFLGPWAHAMDPTAHVYPAIVWILVIWTLAHAGIAIVMQVYSVLRAAWRGG